MPNSIAALHPPTQAYRPLPDGDTLPDVPEYAFSELWQDKTQGLTFGDLLDIVNPLQHIPVVSTIYRMVTGDEIGIGARLAGGALFGGPFGVLGAGAVALLESATGETIERHVAALFGMEPPESDGAPQLAGEALPAPAAATAAEASAGAPPAAAEGTGAAKPVAAAAPAAPAPVAAPAAAADPESEPPQAKAETAEERQRIARAIEQARRAQAGLLLASVEAGRAAEEAEDEAAASPAAAAGDGERDQPFLTHPYMLPPGAPPEAISRAMERALQRYQAMLRQRDAGTTPAAPR